VIAHRVANATNDFASELRGAMMGGEDVDLEQEMVALADEQIRFDAASRLLRRMYDQVRSSIRER
jgi:flagellar basal body rod protein FlgB